MDNLKKTSHASVEDLQDYDAKNCVSKDQGDNITGITGCVRGRGETKKSRADNETVARDRSSSASRSRSPSRDRMLSLHDILRCQRAKYSAGLRANSPPHPIPLQYYDKDDEPEYRREWIKQQEIKAESLNDGDEDLDNSLFTEAIKMVSDGRAQLLVESGYNMYGKPLNEGKNFFDKPFDEEYEMYDWIPRWVRLSKSRTYLP